MPADPLITDTVTVAIAAGATHPGPNPETTGWCQLTLEPTRWADSATLVTHHLRPVLERFPGGWWYIRKHPHWRLRHHHDDPTGATADLHRTLDDLTRTGALRTWHSTIYEPETLAFGGPDGMAIAHDLFHRDSPTTLALLTTAPTRSDDTPGVVELSLLALSRLLRAAGLDWFEQADVWARVAHFRPAPTDAPTAATGADTPAAVRRLLTLDTDPGSPLNNPGGPLRARQDWFAAFDTAGADLRTHAHTGRLTRGLRAVLAHHVIFHWNRLGVPGRTQHALAALARDALLPPDSDPR